MSGAVILLLKGILSHWTTKIKQKMLKTKQNGKKKQTDFNSRIAKQAV